MIPIIRSFSFVAGLICGVVLFAITATGTELVYTPINPSFGGSPLNGSWLLNSAQLQNQHLDEDTTRSPLQEFEDQVARRVLSQLAYKLVEDAFGGYDADLQSGIYQFGDFTIDIETGIDGITVRIVDIVGGGSTTVTVPYYE